MVARQGRHRGADISSAKIIICRRSASSLILVVADQACKLLALPLGPIKHRVNRLASHQTIAKAYAGGVVGCANASMII